MSRELIDGVLNYLGNDDYGSNSKGKYIKFANGTMICYGTGSASTAWASTITFPQTFIQTPHVMVMPLCNISYAIGFTILTVTTSQFTVSYHTNAGEKTPVWFAIGRWK